MTSKEINEAFTAKMKKGIFQPVARHITNLSNAEDRLQDAVCQVWAMYKRYAKRGVILDDAILVKKCRWSACDLGRHFVPADGCWRNRDVLDQRAYRDGHVQVLHIEGVLDDQNVEGDRSLQVGLAEELAASPERKMNSAMDLRKWVGGLTFRDQAIMQRKMEGFTTTEVAAELTQPYLVTYRLEKRLGMELARRAGVRINTAGKRRSGTLRRQRVTADAAATT